MKDQTNTWSRAFKHAVLVTGGVMLLGAMLSGLDSFPNSEAIAEATGSTLFWIFVVVFGASAAFHRGERRGGWCLATLAGLLIGGVFALWISARVQQTRRLPPLTAAEQASLAVSSDEGRLCNLPLGFSLPALDPAFVQAAGLQAQMNARLVEQNAFVWVFQNTDTREIVSIQVSKGIGSLEQTFRGFTTGMSEEASDHPEVTVRNEKVLWSGASGESLLSLSRSDGLEVDFRCLATGSSSHNPPLILCIQTISEDSSNLAEYRSGLTLNGC